MKKNWKLNKGVALLITIIALSLLLTICFGLIAITVSNTKSSLNFQNSQKAYNYSRAGIFFALDKIKQDYYGGYYGGTSKYSQNIGSQGKSFIEIWAPNSNATSAYKIWRITSQGIYNDSNRTLTAWVDMEAFSEYSYFTNNESIGNESEIQSLGEEVPGGISEYLESMGCPPYIPLWWNTGVQITGKVHSNSYFNIRGTPKFNGKVTTSNLNDPRYDSIKSEYNQGGITKDSSKFYRYKVSYKDDFPSGNTDSFSFKGGVPPIYLPKNVDDIKNNATKTYNTDIEVSFTSNGQAEIKYKNDAGIPQVDIINCQKQTIYTSKKITISGGKLSGNVTLSAKDEIEITNDILYNDKEKDLLGIISLNHIVVKTNPNIKKDLQIDGVIMTPKGSLWVDDFYKGIYRGKLKIYGGLISYQRAPVSTFSLDTGNTLTGYNKEYYYDPKLQFLAPPNFPSTGNLKIFSIQDSASL